MVLPPGARPQLHEAVIDLCIEWGFANVTAENLDERLGWPPGELERRHGSVADLQIEVVHRELGRFHDGLDPIRSSGAPWRDRVRGTAYELMRLFTEDERAARFLVFGLRTGDERAQLAFSREIAKMVNLIDEGRGEMENPNSLGRVTAESVTGGIFEQVAMLLRGGPLPPAEEVIPELMYLAVLPYLGVEAAVEELQMAPPMPDFAAPDYPSRGDG